MLAQAVDAGVGDAHAGATGALGLFGEHGGAQLGEVGEALAQGREAQGEHVQAIIEVLAEAAFGDRSLEVDVGGGEDPYVDLEGAVAADGLEGAFLQDAQELGLHVDRHLADLVEEEGAAVGHLEAAAAALGGAGEGALGVAEELALEEGGGDGGAVEGDEGAVGAGAPAVDRAGEALLAGAGLAEEEHGGVGDGDLAGLGGEGPDLRALGALEDAVDLGLGVELAGVLLFLLAQALEGEALFGVLEGEAEDLAVGLDELDDGLRVGLAGGAVEGHDAEGAAGGVEGDDHAGVAGGEVEHAVEGVAVAVAVVVLGEGAGAAGLQGLAQGREVGELEAVLADLAGEVAPGGADDERLVLQGEDGGEVVGGEAADPVEAAAQEVVDGGVAGEVDEGAEVGGHGGGEFGGAHAGGSLGRAAPKCQ